MPQPQPPTGTLTFLFTHVEDSTARWEQQREAMAAEDWSDFGTNFVSP